MHCGFYGRLTIYSDQFVYHCAKRALCDVLSPQKNDKMSFFKKINDILSFAPNFGILTISGTGVYAFVNKFRIMEKLLLCSAFTILVFSAKATGADSLRPHRILPFECMLATADHLGNAYAVRAGGAIEKYDSAGNLTGTYINKRLGEVAAIDAINPMQVLVWYRSFQTLIFLDRTMNEMGRLELSGAGYYGVSIVTTAADGNLWIYDELINKAVKLTRAGDVMFESWPLNLDFRNGFSPVCLRDNGEQVILTDPASGLCQLDQYSGTIGSNPLARTGLFDLAGDWMISADGQKMLHKNIRTLQAYEVDLPHGGEIRGISGHGIFIQRNGRLEWYQSGH